MAQADTVISETGTKYLRLHLADAVGPIMLARLISHFGTIDKILTASAADLEEVRDIGPRRSRAILKSRNDDAVEREIDLAAQAEARIICWEDEEYPTQLRHCDDPPICLYVRGTIQPEDAVSLAIVGTRRCTRYGYEQGRRFAALLANAGFSVVSGMARGVDAAAHDGALVSGGRTIAVLGCGVDIVYPPEHNQLAERILESGAIVSEDPMGSSPTADSFPRRNRIIAGMTLGTIVVEAAKRSGALITARLATEYNREVFAVPGRVDTQSASGTNDLIRSGGAKLISCLEDILDELGDVGRLMATDSAQSATNTSPLANLSKEEKTLVDCLQGEEMDIDQLLDQTSLPASSVTAALTTLQIKGLVQSLRGNRYALRSTSATCVPNIQQ